MTVFSGCGAAMVTPFGRGGGVDYAVLERYIEHLIDGGADALLPFGTTGEPCTVTRDEYIKTVEFIVAHVRGRVPVIVGAGSNSTAAAVSAACDAKSAGANAVLAVTPYYNKCTQNGIIEHYKAIVNAAKLPVICYNVPARTGMNIAPETLIPLKKIGVAGIKEASGDFNHIHAVAKVCCDTGLDFYCGDDGLTNAEMALGACGVISVAANPAPKEIKRLVTLCEKNDYASAAKLRFELDEFLRALFIEVNPIPVKKAMQLLGFDVGAPRLPLTELEPEHTSILEKTMREVGLI